MSVSIETHISQLNDLIQDASETVANVHSVSELQSIETAYLGRKG